MSEYILILLFQLSGPAVTSILFPSQQACETAKTIALDAFKKPTHAYAACVPRGTGQ